MSEMAVNFSRLLERRLNAKVRTTEDSIRYTFFAAVLRSGIRLERIVLEDKHPHIKQAEVDTVILSADYSSREIAMEFKYHRENPSAAGQPVTQKAGEIFLDLARLLKLRSVAARYFVYVTDDELARHLSSPRNRFADFFKLPKGSELKLDKGFFADRSRTFRESMGEPPVGATVKCVISRDLPRNHHLRIYEVKQSVSRYRVRRGRP